MSHVKKAAFAAALAISSAALANPAPKYALKRIPMGPRPDQYVLVRVDTARQAERPYAVTGKIPTDRAERPAARPTPSHPKGTHGPF